MSASQADRADGLSFRRRLPIIRQMEVAECGLACLAMVSSFHGHKIDLPALRARFSVSMKGMSFVGLITTAQQLGLTCRAIRIDVRGIQAIRTPAILHWQANHFVVLREVRRNKVIVHDPARGILELSLAECEEFFSGIAIELMPNGEFLQAYAYVYG